jgi:hypothetical protein
MKILKYVIDNKNIPVIFSVDIIHNTILNNANSAGFVIVEFDKTLNKFIAHCYGESTSLNVKSQKDDKLVIENYLNNHFFFFRN